MASLSNVPPHVRSSIQRNIMELLYLHEHLLDELELSFRDHGRLFKQALTSTSTARGLYQTLSATDPNSPACRSFKESSRVTHVLPAASAAVPQEVAEVARVFKKIVCSPCCISWLHFNVMLDAPVLCLRGVLCKVRHHGSGSFRIQPCCLTMAVLRNGYRSASQFDHCH